MPRFGLVIMKDAMLVSQWRLITSTQQDQYFVFQDVMTLLAIIIVAWPISWFR